MRKHILYLASGSSRRFGENKLLFAYQGKPLFLWGLEMLADLTRKREDCTLTVVSRYEAIREAARRLGIPSTDSPNSELGVSYTIRAGLDALGCISEADYLLFVVADQPDLAQQSVQRLLDLTDTGVLCASLCYGDRPGNPSLFSASLIPELQALEGDRGGRAVLKRHDCVYVQAQAPEELMDIDTKADLLS